MKCLVVILLGLCLVHFRHANAEIKVLHKSIDGRDKILIYPYLTYYDEHLTYALCYNNRGIYSEDGSYMNCTVIREKTPYGNDPQSCDVIVKRYRHFDYLPEINIFPFENYVAINLYEPSHKDTYLNFTTVQWKNCRVGKAIIDTKLQVTLPFANFKVVGHNDSYDVILYNDDLVSYVNKSSKITIDADGHVIDGPSTSTVSLTAADIIQQYIVPLYGSSSGYLQIKTYNNDNDDAEYIQVLVKPNESEQVLATYRKPLSHVYLSTKNNLLGACYQTKSEVNCTQHDYNGNLKLQITIPRSFNIDGPALVNNYNLPNGGFYLLDAQCPDGKNCEKWDDRQFSIERIDANGTRTGSMKFQGLEFVTDYPDSTSWLFYENGTNGTCLSVLFPYAYHGKKQLDLIANCFTNADFSMQI